MKKAIVFLIFFTGLAAMSWTSPENLAEGNLKLKSMSALAFGPDGVLFVGDSIGGRIAAVDIGDKTPNESKEPLAVQDLEGKLASLLGVDASDVMVHDMAVNPVSQNVYFAVSSGRKKWDNRWKLPNDVANAGILLRLNPGSGKIEEVSLEKVKHGTVSLSNPIDPEAEHSWKKTKKRVDAITDIEFEGGRVYVAGLSNEEFASTMWVFPYPFSEKGTATTLEIYHGAHGAYETSSPVRTFLPYKINGKSHLVASYLCTPLVTFPVEELKDKEHIRGKTIAELGFGNYPLDMVSYTKEGKGFILLINSSRGMMRFSADELEKPIEGITGPAKTGEGIHFDTLPGSGVQQLALLNEQFMIALTRQPNGLLDISSIPLRRL